MRCPKCRSEIGNQSVCPYCGTTVYIQGSTWSTDTYNQHAPTRARDGAIRNWGPDPGEMGRRLRNLESKVNVILILQCGCFVLLILILIILALI